MHTPRRPLRYLLGGLLGLALVGGVALALFAINALTSSSASASPTCTITFNNSTGDNEWGTAANWTTDSLPTSSSVVCFAAGVTSVVFDTGNGQTVDDIEGSGVTLQVLGGTLSVQDASNTSVIGNLEVTAGTIDFFEAATIPSVTLEGGTIGGSGPIAATTLDWTSGSFVGSSGSSAMTVSGTTTISTGETAGLALIQSFTLNADGGAGFVSAGITDPGLQLQYGGFLNLEGTSTIPAGYQITNYSTAAVTVQPGAMLKDTGASGSTVTIAAPLDDNGTVQLMNSGQTFVADGGGTSAGNFVTSAGSVLELASMTINGNINPSATSPGTDTVDIQFSTVNGTITTGTLATDGGGGTTFNGGFDIGALTVSNSTFDMNGSTVSYTVTGAVTLDGGTIGGNGSLSSGTLAWSSGDFSGGGAGSITVTGATTITTGESTLTADLQSYVVNADGGATFTTAGITDPGFQLQYGGFLSLGGTSTIPGGYQITNYSTAAVTVQPGAMLKDTGASGSTVTIGAPLDDNGTVQLMNSGQTFVADGGGTSAGNFVTSAGSVLELASMTINGNINPSATSPGTDTLDIQNSTVNGTITTGTLATDGSAGTTFNGGFDISALTVSNSTFDMNGSTASYTVTGAVTLDGGTIGGNGSLSSGALAWSSGDFIGSGSGSITVTGATTITTGETTQTSELQSYLVNADGGATFTTVGVTDPGFQLQYGGFLSLGGTSTIPGGYQINSYSTAAVTVQPGATLQDTGASGSTVVLSVPLDDNGTVQLMNSGQTFVAVSGGTSAGNFVTSAGSVLELANMTINGNINPSATSPGTDTLDIQSSTVNGTITTGTLATDGGGSTTFNGGFDVGALTASNSTFDMNGSTVSYTVTGAVTLDGGTIGGSGAVGTATLAWSSGDFIGSGAGSITVTGATTITTGEAKQTAQLQSYVVNADDGATFSTSGITEPGFQLQYSGYLSLGGTSTIPAGYQITSYSTAAVTVQPGAMLQDTGASGSTVVLSVPLDDNGTVQLMNSGQTFVADGGGTSAGNFVTSAGSVLELANMTINGNINPSATSPGTDTLDIQSSTVNGTITTGTLATDGGNSSTFNGGFDVGALTVSNSGFYMQGTTVTYVVTGAVTLSGGTIGGSGALSAGTFSWSSGDLSGSGSTASLTVSGLTTISTSYATYTSYLTQYTLDANGGIDFVAAPSDSGFTIQYGGTINLGGSSTMPGAYTLSIYSSGGLNVLPGATLTIGSSAGPTEIGASFTTAGTVTIPSGAAVDFNNYSETGGTTDLAAASSKMTVGTVALSGGTFEGYGEVAGTLDNTGGNVQPGGGASPGTLDVVGSYDQSSGGTLVATIAGAAAGTGYGQLAATSASVAGTLDLVDQANFKPTSADLFNVVEASVGGVTGTFGTVTPTGFSAPDNVTYSTTAVQVTFQASATPVIHVTSTSANTVYGQAVTFTATVTGGSTVATGTIQFKDGTADLGSAQALSSGAASITSSTLGAATHSITAVYSGDPDYSPGTSAPYTEKVTPAGTTMNFSPSVNPAGAGQKVALVATVTANSPSGAVPSGAVTFYNGTTKLGTATLSSSGVATYTTTFKKGSYSLKATYPSSTDFGASSGTSTLKVVSTGSTTTITESATRVLTNVAVKFTATVKATSGTAKPTGKVVFYNGSTALGSGVALNSSGVATASYSFRHFGTEKVTAKYGGTTGFGGSISSAVSLLVQEQGYRMAGQDGGVFDFGGAGYYGSLPHSGIVPTTNVVDITNTPDGLGYWLVTAGDSSHPAVVYPFGDAKTHSADQSATPQGIIALLSTADGKGYWLVSSKGTVYRYGDASSYGSKALSNVVSAAVTPDAKGYWMLTSAGKVYPFGDAKTASAITGQKPVSGTVSRMSPTLDGKGYYLVNTAGVVFCFGDAKSYGNIASPTASVIGLAVDAYGNGLWAAASDGSVYALGSAPNDGGVSGSQLTAPIAGMAMFP